MYDFSPVEKNAILHVRIRADYPSCVKVLQEFAYESEWRSIGRISGMVPLESGGYIFRVLCNSNMEHLALFYLALCGINKLDHEIEYERENTRRILEERSIPLPRALPGTKL